MALEAWSFMGGWFPERLPLFATLRDLPDVHDLIEATMHLRNSLNNAKAG